MKEIRYPSLAAFGLALSLVTTFALASGDQVVSYVRFDWSAPGLPGTVSLPLPSGLEIGEIDSVSLPGDIRLAGFALESDPAQLQLGLLPPKDEVITFTVVDLRLSSAHRRRFEFGHAAVMPVAGESGPLSFERSLAATAAGLYQAVALRNSGDRELLIYASRYLPGGIQEGRLLVARGEPVELLSRLEASMSPAALREARRTGEAYPQLEGFSWLPADDLDLRLAPREAVVLAWTDASLPPAEEPTSFDLRPVVEYRVATGSAGLAGSRLLGLPVTVRRGP